MGMQSFLIKVRQSADNAMLIYFHDFPAFSTPEDYYKSIFLSIIIG